MEKVIYNLVFNRKKQLNAEGKALIQVEAYLNRQKRYFSTKVYVKPCQWDNKRRSIKNHPNMDALNLYLQNYVMELERDELEKRQANNGFSLKDLREEASSTSTSSSFLVFMREEILHSNLKESTLKNHLSTLHVLSFKSRKTKRDGCEKRNAFIETKTKCASNLIRKVTAYLQNQSKTPSLYIKINGIQMDF